MKPDKATVKVLIVDDDEADYVILSEIFSAIQEAQYEIKWVTRYEEALEEALHGAYDICFFDCRLMGYSGLELLKEAISRGCETPIILMTGQGDKEIDMEAMRIGAYDYLVKGNFDGDQLERTTRYAIERKRSESALKIAKEGAESANRAKTEFLANVGHELRTPINGIMGMVDLSLTTKLSSEQQDYMNLIKSSTEVLLIMINDILDYSKIEAGRIELESVPMNLNAMVTEVMDLEAIRLKEKGLELLIKYDSKVPSDVVGDPVRIRQIVANLVSNPVRFTSRGQVILSVIAEETTPDEIRFRILVKDTGIGIASDKFESIFEKFVQADASTTRQYGGTGLGLSICKGLVELLGGSMGLDSELGKGSTFWFTLTLPISKKSVSEIPS